MNDNNNLPNNNDKLPAGWGSFNNGKLPEEWGNFNNGNVKSSPWENAPKTTAWRNSNQTSVWKNPNQTPAWGNTNNNSKSSHSKPKSVNTENVNEAINKLAGMAKQAGEKAANKISEFQNKKNSSDETVNKDGKEAFIKSVPTTAETVSERLRAIELPQINSISKEEPEIYIPESEKENLDYIIEKYIEKTGYQPSWKFERYCAKKTGLEADSAAKKYRIKIFTFYMRDLLTVIAEVYKFDYVKLYKALPMYQNFFIDETGNLNIDLLVKASSPIIKKLIEGGMLTADGEGRNTVFINNNIEPSPEEATEQESVSEQEKEVITEPVKLTDNFIKPSEPVVPDNKNTYIVKKSENFKKWQDDTPIFKSNYDPIEIESNENHKIYFISIAVIVVGLLIISMLVTMSLKNKDKNFVEANGSVLFYNTEETTEKKTEADNSDKFKYEKRDENNDGVYDYIVITGCDESMTTVTVPSEIDGLPVRELIEALSGDSLKTLNIPESVTRICNNEIEGYIGSFPCPNLESINVSENNPNFTSIDGVLFSKDKSYMYSFPKGKAKEYAIPYGTNVIDCGAFNKCSNLVNVSIPDSVTLIDIGAFSYCSNLKSITIPNSVTEIRFSAFYNCSGLTSITVENSNCEIFNTSSTISNIGESYYTGVIRGYTGSTAQAYANEKGYRFEAIDQQVVTTETPTDPPVTESQNTITQYPSEKLANYPQYVDTAKEYQNNSYNYFSLIDINSDNIPELFITDENKVIGAIYTLINDNSVSIIDITIANRLRGKLYVDGCFNFYGALGQIGGNTYYKYDSGSEPTLILTSSYEYKNGGQVTYSYRQNGIEYKITKEEYDAIEYSHGGVLDIQATPISRFVSTAESQAAIDNKNSKKEYTTEEIVNAAGSDFYFYDQPPYSYSRTVAIESGSLNLRAAPSTNADIIIQMPKGAVVGEFGTNGEWSCVGYTVNGKDYLGYASSQFLH